jgi:hypothetical protein
MSLQSNTKNRSHCLPHSRQNYLCRLVHHGINLPTILENLTRNTQHATRNTQHASRITKMVTYLRPTALVLLILFLTFLPLAFGWSQASPQGETQASRLPLGTIIAGYFAVSLGLIALCLLSAVYFPNQIERIVYFARYSGRRAFLVGLGNFVFLLILTILLGQLKDSNPLKFLLLLPLIVLVIGSLVGFIAGVQVVGYRIAELREKNSTSSFEAILTGAVAIELIFLVPLLGQIVFVCILMQGFGAGIAALFRRKSDHL